VVLVATGVAAGLFGAGLMYLLFSVEHLAFGYDTGDLESGARQASDLRRMASLVTAGRPGVISRTLSSPQQRATRRSASARTGVKLR